MRAALRPLALAAAGRAEFRIAGTGQRIRFVLGGDTAGQGWGINPFFGGMRIYEAMRRRSPDFFIHSGDTIYADGPIRESVKTADGQIWHNVVTPDVAKVAETLAEFRGRYKYNLLDENVRRFNAEVPQIWQWDDHEVVNNWSPSKDLTDDPAYHVKDVRLLVARGARAFQEYAPLRPYDATAPERVYRRIPYGPLLDVFYDPRQAQFRDFLPFREFVAGPLNAGSFGPQPLDDTFGPQLEFFKTGPHPNASPLAGAQFFGEVNIDPEDRTLAVDLRDIEGTSVYRKVLAAE